MNAKTLLILPPRTVQITGSLEAHQPPLGLAYLAAMLESKGHKVKIIDAVAEGLSNKAMVSQQFLRVGLSDEELARRIKSYAPDVVGISCMFTAFKDDGLRVAAIAKEAMPDALTVLGGAHVSANPEQTAREPNADIAIFGEGELTLLEIVEQVEKGKKPAKIDGTAVKSGKGVKRNKPRQLLPNLDLLPFPARHLLPMDIYFGLQRQNYAFSMRYPIIELISSRGCPGKCVFCAVHAIWGRCWRPRSAGNVVDEIEYCMQKYGAREVNFTDDNISLSKKRMIEICKEIIGRKLDIKWHTPNGIAIWTLDKEVLAWMRKSGYYRAKFGLETGSSRMQKYIGKNIDLAYAKEVIKECNRAGIWTASSFMIGFPDETEEDINQTIEFANSTHLDFARFLIAQPYAGTQLFDQFAEKGLLQGKRTKASSAFHTSYDTAHLTAKQLNEIRISAHKQFMRSRVKLMLNPGYFFTEFLPKVASTEDFTHFVRNAFTLLKGKTAGKKKTGTVQQASED